MKGRIWLILGVAAGIAIGLGKVPYFAGAASTLTDTAQRIVGSGGTALMHSAAKHGAAHRIVQGLAALIGLLVPGVTALLLIACARFTLRLRILVGLLVLVLGIAGYHYLGHGAATGTLLFALVAAALAVAATGPLVAAPLAALAALIGTRFLPRLAEGKRSVPRSALEDIHRALTGHRGAPIWLEVVAIIVVAIPFAVAARLVVR